MLGVLKWRFVSEYKKEKNAHFAKNSLKKICITKFHTSVSFFCLRCVALMKGLITCKTHGFYIL